MWIVTGAGMLTFGAGKKQLLLGGQRLVADGRQMEAWSGASKVYGACVANRLECGRAGGTYRS